MQTKKGGGKGEQCISIVKYNDCFHKEGHHVEKICLLVFLITGRKGCYNPEEKALYEFR